MCEQIVLEWRRGQTDGWQMTERQRKTTAYPIIICPRTPRAPQFRNANMYITMRPTPRFGVTERGARRVPTPGRPGAVHDRGKSEFGEGSGRRTREGSRLFSDGKEEEGGRKLSAGI